MMSLFASDKDIAEQIYLSIAKGISKKSNPSFYLQGKVRYIKSNSKLHIVNRCEDADIIITNNMDEIKETCKEKLIMTNKYRIYNKDKNIIAAFFWQKGRPNIILRKSVLQKHNIILDPSYSKFIE
jgi:hypothetical protein